MKSEVCQFASEKSGVFFPRKTNSADSDPKNQVAQHARKINEMNKIFLGEKQNTDYLKVNKV